MQASNGLFYDILQVVTMVIGLVIIIWFCKVAIRVVYKNTKYMLDEEEGKPYESIEDWKNEIKHLKWPTIVMVFLIIMLTILINIYFPN